MVVFVGRKLVLFVLGGFMDTDVYHSPFDKRYTSLEMNRLFSDNTKFSTWRELWVALAKAEQELGLNISDEQIAEMEMYVHDINYEVADAREKEVRHDVMAHVYAFGQQAKSAEGIIHLGATSCYVTDNTDILLIKQAFGIIRPKLLGLIKLLEEFAEENKDLPTLGYTHYQPATPTTVGKRATLWLQSFVEDLRLFDFVISELKMLGCRGATGSSETFMKLFDGDEEKCKKLDHLIAENFGFSAVYPVSGQTYPRGLDYLVSSALATFAASAYKMAQDIRLLQHDKEIEEPFAKNQIGSSAMAYKRNPMRSERICSIARYLGGLPTIAWETAATQMLERTLDDSAGRRIYIPDAFRATDAILILCSNVVDGLVVNKGVIGTRLNAELPFMATEDMIMKAVEKGANRQEMHAKIREHSLKLGQMVKSGELSAADVCQKMIDIIDADADIPLDALEVTTMLDASKLIGRCSGQVTDYLEQVVRPLLASESDAITIDTEVSV